MFEWNCADNPPPKYNDTLSFEVEVMDCDGIRYPAHYDYSVGDWYNRDGTILYDIVQWRYMQNEYKKEPRTREDFLDFAKDCIAGQREQDYGSPEENFRIIAKLWTAYLGMDVTAVDVSMMMCLLKIARIRNGGGTGDSFVDLAGYAACGGEIHVSTTDTKVAEAV